MYSKRTSTPVQRMPYTIYTGYLFKPELTLKSLTIVHTCLYRDAPDYLKELLKKKEKLKRTLRSNTSNQIDLDLIIPFNSKKTFSDQSFSFMGPYLWNNLPYDLKSIVQYDNFKRKCKTFLFRKYFNC